MATGGTNLDPPHQKQNNAPTDITPRSCSQETYRVHYIFINVVYIVKIPAWLYRVSFQLQPFVPNYSSSMMFENGR
jgi:hypothetical protein